MSALLLALALQAPAAAPPTPPGQATPLGQVTVDAPRPPPKLVRAYPAAGATPPFGVLVLTLAYDQPMDPASAPRIAGPSAPECLPTWRLLPDARTFVLLCSLKPGAAYRLAFPAEARAFRSTQSKTSDPLDLAFTADADKPEISLADALKSAGLKPEDGPVMDWRGGKPAG
jgi:hypothetical protein